MKKKRILAWICILFLVGMYVTDFVLALIGSDLARNCLLYTSPYRFHRLRPCTPVRLQPRNGRPDDRPS